MVSRWMSVEMVVLMTGLPPVAVKWTSAGLHDRAKVRGGGGCQKNKIRDGKVGGCGWEWTGA